MIKLVLYHFRHSYARNVFKVGFLLAFFLQSFAIHLDDCSWTINIVEKDNTSLTSSLILPGKSYFFRLQVECSSMINSLVARDLALTGTTPSVQIESKAFIANSQGGYHVKEFHHIIKTALVELGNQTQCHCLEYASTSSKCFCGNKHPTCSGLGLKPSTTCCHIEQECPSSNFFCNPAWLAPLPLNQGVAVLKCTVVKKGIGLDIHSKSFVFHVDGFHDLTGPVNNTLGPKVDYIPNLQGRGAFSINCVPQLSTSCVIAGIEQSNVVFYSSSEFAATDVIEIQGILSGTSVCTAHYTSLNVIKGALSFLDSIIFNTPFGLIEVAGTLSTESSISPGSRSNVLRRCIKSLIGPTEVKSHLTTVLALGEEPHHQKIFLASKQPGASVSFVELLNADNLDVCQFLKSNLQTSGSTPCTVVTASILQEDKLVVLVELDSTLLGRYHLVDFIGQTSKGQWSLVFSIPSQVPGTYDKEAWLMVDPDLDNSSSDQVILQPVLNGMSHTAVISSNIYMWGNMLLYSFDGGRSIQRLTTFTSSSNITLFTSSLDGIYALFTDTKELWIGVIGSAKLSKIESSAEFWPRNTGLEWDYHANRTVITMFFDSMDQLQQVIVSSSNTTHSCISRLPVPVEDIITSQNLHLERLNNWKVNEAIRSSNSPCPLNQSTTDPSEVIPTKYVSQICPYARIKVEAPRTINTSRVLRYILDPPTINDSILLHSMDDVLGYLSAVSDTYQIDHPVSAIDENTTDSELPEEISLYRHQSYSFDIYLYLNEDEQTGTSSNPWTMDNLQISFRVSDPSVIDVLTTREELIPYGAVKYKVTLQDKGVDFPQKPPGEGLVAVSLHVETWNSALSCMEESQSGYRHFTGSQLMTIYLGCPANLKVIFDDQMSMDANGKSHYCRSGETVPCFLFDLAFYPLFNIVDLSSGDVTPFLGHYTLKVVGGGLTVDDIRDYTTHDQESFNFRTTGSSALLVWAAKEKSLATIPVFNRSTNGIQWLCGTESPCANIDPKFPDNAEYFFKVEFSNKGVDISNCDYTIRFIIRVHGLPPGSFNPSSVIVLSCIVIMATVILTLFFFKRQDYKLWRSMKKAFLDAMNSCLEEITNQKVEPEDELEMEGMDGMEGMDATNEGTYRNPVGIAWDDGSKISKQPIEPTETSNED